jgi:hypothetical protein
MTSNIFVFGSNLAGRHGKGSALKAKTEYGAVNGIGFGPQGNAYAIPTKGYNLEILALNIIQAYVWEFMAYAIHRNEKAFDLVAIGCGLAGYRPEQIGPMFEGCPINVNVPDEFKPYINRRT